MITQEHIGEFILLGAKYRRQGSRVDSIQPNGDVVLKYTTVDDWTGVETHHTMVVEQRRFYRTSTGSIRVRPKR